MNRISTNALRLAFATATTAALTLPLQAQVIDDFESGPIAPTVDNVDDFSGPGNIQFGLPTSSVIGGVRDYFVFLGAGTSIQAELDLSGPGDHGLEIEIAPNSSGVVFLSYNAGDPNTGLGPIDLNGSGNDGIAVDLELDPNLQGELFIEITDPNFAVAETQLNETLNGGFVVPFSEFSTSLNPEDASPHTGDFTQVSSINVQVQLRNLTPQPKTLKIFALGGGDSGACPADVTNDGQVNLSDLAELLAQFGQSGAGLSADISGDGMVDLTDLAELLAAFGTSC